MTFEKLSKYRQYNLVIKKKSLSRAPIAFVVRGFYVLQTVPLMGKNKQQIWYMSLKRNKKKKQYYMDKKKTTRVDYSFAQQVEAEVDRSKKGIFHLHWWHTLFSDSLNKDLITKFNEQNASEWDRARPSSGIYGGTSYIVE